MEKLWRIGIICGERRKSETEVAQEARHGRKDRIRQGFTEDD
jgi:hypothetical protein